MSADVYGVGTPLISTAATALTAVASSAVVPEGSDVPRYTPTRDTLMVQVGQDLGRGRGS